jgi:hypothetical protein
MYLHASVIDSDPQITERASWAMRDAAIRIGCINLSARSTHCRPRALQTDQLHPVFGGMHNRPIKVVASYTLIRID